MMSRRLAVADPRGPLVVTAAGGVQWADGSPVAAVEREGWLRRARPVPPAEALTAGAEPTDIRPLRVVAETIGVSAERLRRLAAAGRIVGAYRPSGHEWWLPWPLWVWGGTRGPGLDRPGVRVLPPPTD